MYERKTMPNLNCGLDLIGEVLYGNWNEAFVVHSQTGETNSILVSSHSGRSFLEAISTAAQMAPCTLAFSCRPCSRRLWVVVSERRCDETNGLT